MSVGDDDDDERQGGEEVAGKRPLCRLVRIKEGGGRQAGLHRDQGAGEMNGEHHEANDGANDQAAGNLGHDEETEIECTQRW